MVADKSAKQHTRLLKNPLGVLRRRSEPVLSLTKERTEEIDMI